MPQIINTNVASLNAQRNLNKSQSALNISLQRLSSGLRINSAKDDAAGLAISERMTAQVRGLNQAVRNANDGISLAQPPRGRWERRRIAPADEELAVQAVNATNSASDRVALNKEVSQLIGEITRIGDTTSFNGLKMLDGTYTDQVYQVGANVGETISISLGDARASALGATESTSTSGLTGTIDYTTGITINGTAIDTSSATSLNDVVNAVNAQVSATGVSARVATTNTVDTGAIHVPTGTAATIDINGTQVDPLAMVQTSMPPWRRLMPRLPVPALLP